MTNVTNRLLLALILLTVVSIPCGCARLTPLADKRNAVPPFEDHGIKHVVLLILENGSPTEAAQQEFMKLLEKRGTRLDRYFAVAHPSQPNYVTMISGSAKDALTDSPLKLDRPHLGRILGSRWKVYAENYPGSAGKCFLDKDAKGGYVRRHIPFLSFVDVQKSDCAQIVRLESATDPIAALRADVGNGKLPDFALIIPNLTHDGHEPSNIPTANTWLMANIAKLAFSSDTVFILTFDEDETHTNNARHNRVYTVIAGEHVKVGVNTDVYDHEDLLATIAALLHVAPPPLDEAGARAIGGIWN